MDSHQNLRPSDPENDIEGMRLALRLAASAQVSGDVPVGAVVLDSSGHVIGQGFNCRERDADPVGHAEVVALRAAAHSLDRWRLTGCTLVVTLEPCVMCAGAILQSRIDRLVFGAWDDKAGAVGSMRDVIRDPRALHQVEVHGGLLLDECAALLQNFFRQRRPS